MFLDEAEAWRKWQVLIQMMCFMSSIPWRRVREERHDGAKSKH